MNVLIAGAGYIGRPLAERLAADGHTVTAVRRTAQTTHGPVRWLAADLARGINIEDLPEHLDAVVFCASPDGFDEAAYRRAFVQAQTVLLDSLQQAGLTPTRYIMIGSTAVYPPGQGEWIDTDSTCQPERFSGRILLEAERTLAQRLGDRLVVARLTGIYGPGRSDSMIQRLLQKGCNPQQYTNRIHRDDAVGFLAHLLTLDKTEPVYLVSDDQPVDQCTLARWLAEHLGRAAPAVDCQRWSPRGNRRVRNRAMHESGYRLTFPDFRTGLADALSRSP